MIKACCQSSVAQLDAINIPTLNKYCKKTGHARCTKITINCRANLNKNGNLKMHIVETEFNLFEVVRQKHQR